MLQIGDQAPDFEVKDQNGNVVRMSDFKGKKVVLYFYPKDDTPGCTAQACNLRDNYDALLAKGFVVLGVSVDDEKSHQKFVQKFDLPFPLLADTEHEIVEKYGVWQEKSMYGRKYMGTMRYTFVVNEEGKIEDIITKVDTKNHTAQLLK
ncbi:thiol peroxidase [Rufibacter radiotolerans]|uniref:thioredoxin-dependent peroxiredoxin n=1 Tax=Rufibacter radiotolerans TaxID=1379910 RepID=A0A0H4VPL0_9BACT|nr:thioredoxin-dependent thiol peroxidase [Rufibacter radiotolerans]AKQ45867.1 thiol peroxidase [Rufibacter radiotolerans]